MITSQTPMLSTVQPAGWRDINALGVSHAQLSDWNRATQAFEQASKALTVDATDDARVLLSSNLAAAHFHAGNVEAALISARASLALRERIWGPSVATARAKSDLATILFARGEHDLARALLDDAIHNVSMAEGDDARQLVPFVENAARAAIAAGDLARAEPLVLRLHGLLDAHELPVEDADALFRFVIEARSSTTAREAAPVRVDDERRHVTSETVFVATADVEPVLAFDEMPEAASIVASEATLEAAHVVAIEETPSNALVVAIEDTSEEAHVVAIEDTSDAAHAVAVEDTSDAASVVVADDTIAVEHVAAQVDEPEHIATDAAIDSTGDSAERVANHTVYIADDIRSNDVEGEAAIDAASPSVAHVADTVVEFTTSEFAVADVPAAHVEATAAPQEQETVLQEQLTDAPVLAESPAIATALDLTDSFTTLELVEPPPPTLDHVPEHRRNVYRDDESLGFLVQHGTTVTPDEPFDVLSGPIGPLPELARPVTTAADVTATSNRLSGDIAAMPPAPPPDRPLRVTQPMALQTRGIHVRRPSREVPVVLPSPSHSSNAIAEFAALDEAAPRNSARIPAITNSQVVPPAKPVQPVLLDYPRVRASGGARVWLIVVGGLASLAAAIGWYLA